MSQAPFGIVRSPSHLLALVTTIAAVFLFMTPPPAGVPQSAFTGAALGLLAVGLYATVAIPEFLTALVFFTLAMVIGAAPADVVFSGFHSTAFWMVFGGLIIGVAVQKTGLGARLATTITAKFAGSYFRVVCGVALVSIALALLMPSTMGRIILLAPIVLALADKLEYGQGSRERTGLVMTLACASWMPSSAILPANVPNMVLVGVAENMFGMTFNYGEYMLMHMPVNGIIKAVSVVALVFMLFPSAKTGRDIAFDVEPAQPLRPEGRRLALILAVTLGFWVTDFIHHISPAWVAMAAAVVCMLPGIGIVNGDDLKTKVNFPSAIYVAGILSLGAVLVETGAGEWIGGWLLAHIPLSKDAPLMSFFSIIGLGTVVNMVATAPSVPAIVGPMASELSNLTGIPLRTVLMSQVIAYSTVILPYQVPPLIVAMQLGGVSLRDGARMTIALAAVSLIVLVPLNYLWWVFLGLL
ncbi:SLC13 family permease [Thalassospiraceae bacterium LMO-JJ14]|nr:SLC13 family permease [Thalassospiraceae bacterium LMO-JJ14]